MLEVFGLATLRHLPDIEKLEEEGLLQWPQTEAALYGAFGLQGRRVALRVISNLASGSAGEDTREDAYAALIPRWGSHESR
jgi:hypothetical protein